MDTAKKAYLVISGDYDGDTIWGCFTNEKAAGECCAEVNTRNLRCGATIEERPLDVPREQWSTVPVRVLESLEVCHSCHCPTGGLDSIRLPGFQRGPYTGMRRDVPGAWELHIEVHADTEEEGRKRAIEAAALIKAAVLWGDNDVLKAWQEGGK